MTQGSRRFRPFRLMWRLFVLTGAVYALFLLVWGPPNSLHPLCTYDVNAKVEVDVVFEGDVYSGSAIHQNSRSRGWISIMNAAGCPRMHGTAVPFETPDGRAVLVSTRLCHDVHKNMPVSGPVDVLAACDFEMFQKRPALILDSATAPTRWANLIPGKHIEIVRMTATSTWRHPADTIEDVVPGLLRAEFESAPERNRRTPESMLDYRRRTFFRSDEEPAFFMAYDPTLADDVSPVAPSD